MANSNRLAKPYLKALAADPEMIFEQGFAPLIRYLDANSTSSARIGYSVSPKQDCVRFGQTPLLHFYSSAFTGVNFESTTGEYKLKNSYWGMLGINGPLPSHLTEYAIERKYRLKDDTFAEFLDIFNHRFISLFYRAWADAQPVVSHDRPEQDSFKNKLQALSGEQNGSEGLFNQNNNIHQYLSGLFSQKNRSGKALTQILSEYLQLDVSVDEFQGRWYDIEPEQKTRLGQSNALLGVDSVAGNRTYQRCFNFSINIGPMDYEQYIGLLNSSQRLKSIVQLTQKMVGQEYEFSIHILLQKCQTKPSILGSAKLGINSWCQGKSSHLLQRDNIVAYKKAS